MGIGNSSRRRLHLAALIAAAFFLQLPAVGSDADLDFALGCAKLSRQGLDLRTAGRELNGRMLEDMGRECEQLRASSRRLYEDSDPACAKAKLRGVSCLKLVLKRAPPRSSVAVGLYTTFATGLAIRDQTRSTFDQVASLMDGVESAVEAADFGRFFVESYSAQSSKQQNELAALRKLETDKLRELQASTAETLRQMLDNLSAAQPDCGAGGCSNRETRRRSTIRDNLVDRLAKIEAAGAPALTLNRDGTRE